MRFFVILLFTFLRCLSSKALECGIHMNESEEMKSVVLKCVKNNKTLEDLRNLGAYSSESSSSSNSDERPGLDSILPNQFRTRRDSNQLKPVVNNSTDPNKTLEEVSENCIIHCIFTNLNLTDGTGYPIHSKIVSGLLKKSHEKEVQDFLQDTADGCFQEMSREINIDPCEYSTKLVTCMTDRGKMNCADWPVGDLPMSSQ